MAAKFVIDDDNDSKRMVRISDMVEEPRKMLMPIKGYEKMPLVSLEEAVQPLVSLLPDVRRMAWTAMERCEEPADGLTCDESASIMLYSMEWEPHDECLYFVLNAALRTADRRKLQVWFLYLRLILTALGRLPSTSLTVYRGIKLDLHIDYPKDKKFVWWGFSSCTRSVGVLQSEQFLGTEGDRTLFSINCYSGKNICNHSYFEKEDEILLLIARQFTVASSLNSGNGLHIIQIDEMEPEYPLLEPLPSISFYVVPLKNAQPPKKPISTSTKITSSKAISGDADSAMSHMQKNKCQYGGECRQIDEEEHTQEFEHPAYCSDGGNCQNMQETHLKQHRHLPLCRNAQKCMDYLKRVKKHCEAYRHCYSDQKTKCRYGSECQQINDARHTEVYEHPAYCPDGGNCQNLQEMHLKQYFHLPFCTYGYKCMDYLKHVKKHCEAFRHCYDPY